MKVGIKQDGTMYIEAETELESYALRSWCEENKNTFPETGSMMVIKTMIESKDGK